MRQSKLYTQIREVMLEQYKTNPCRVIANEMNVGMTKVYHILRGFQECGVKLSSIMVTPDLEDALEKWGYRIELVKEGDILDKQ